MRQNSVLRCAINTYYVWERLWRKKTNGVKVLDNGRKLKFDAHSVVLDVANHEFGSFSVTCKEVNGFVVFGFTGVCLETKGLNSVWLTLTLPFQV